MMMKCKDCGSLNQIRTLQTFKDGTQHLRLDCRKCGIFVGYLENAEGASEFKQELFNLVRALSEAKCTGQNMEIIRRQARLLIGKAVNGPSKKCIHGVPEFWCPRCSPVYAKNNRKENDAS